MGVQEKPREHVDARSIKKEIRGDVADGWHAVTARTFENELTSNRRLATEISVLENMCSCTITAKTSADFLIRVTSPKNSQRAMVFSDFVFCPDDDILILHAFHLLRDLSYGPVPGMKLVFQNIYPTYGLTFDHEELIRRHDQIVHIATRLMPQLELAVSNFFLDPRSEKFDTLVYIVRLEQLPSC